MALKRNKPAATAAAQEPTTTAAPTPEPVTTAAPAPEPATTTPNPNPTVAAPPATRPAATAPVVMGAKGTLDIIWEGKRDAFISKYGELPRLKATNGNILDSDEKPLGRWIELQVLSFNSIFVVSPNDKKAAVELVRYSYDNETFPDFPGETVAEHLQDLKVNYPDASSKEYYEVIAVLRAGELPSTHVGGMVQIQLAPTSVTAFEGYRKQTTFKIATGNMDPTLIDLVRMDAVAVSAKGNAWTKLVPTVTQM